MEKTVAGASIMDVICCHNVEQEVSLGSSFKMLIFGRDVLIVLYHEIE